MDGKRAQEIADSPVMANVTYNGTAVYIEHVDQVKQQATVHPLDNPSKKHSVNVITLEEH